MRFSYRYLIVSFVLALCTGCAPVYKEEPGRTGLAVEAEPMEPAVAESLLQPQGGTVASRFAVPTGYCRATSPEGSYGAWLRALPLKADGEPVRYYDGRIKGAEVHAAVLDMPLGNRDLQQCADSIMRLRAEYLFQAGRSSDIRFHFTNGFEVPFQTWCQGKRIQVSGNDTVWTGGGRSGADSENLHDYLNVVYAYAGTLSLEKEMVPVPAEGVEIGDILIQGGSPGHCVVVMDKAVEKSTGKQMVMLAQGYMPAQDIHILKNESAPAISPWYPVEPGGAVETPQWSFTWDQVMRFPE